MANEIQVTASLSVSSNGISISGSKTLSATLAGNAYASTVQSLAGTTREAISIAADITLGGFMFIQNLSTTGTAVIQFDNAAADATNTIAALLPGEVCLFKPASGATVYATPTESMDIAIVVSEL